MAGGFEKLQARSVADTLWLTGKFRNYYVKVGDHLVPDSSGPFIAEEIQLVRIR